MNGVLSVPLCAKCLLFRSRICLNKASESVISISESDVETITLSNEPGLHPFTIFVRCLKASHFISLLSIALKRF